MKGTIWLFWFNLTKWCTYFSSVMKTMTMSVLGRLVWEKRRERSEGSSKGRGERQKAVEKERQAMESQWESVLSVWRECKTAKGNGKRGNQRTNRKAGTRREKQADGAGKAMQAFLSLCLRSTRHKARESCCSR